MDYRLGDLVIEHKWLTFLELAPIWCLLFGISFWWLALGVTCISYGLHFASKNSRYLMENTRGSKVFLFICCPVIYLLSLAALFLPVIPLRYGPVSMINLPWISLFVLVSIMMGIKFSLPTVFPADSAKESIRK